jgi:hypothetical protein
VKIEFLVVAAAEAGAIAVAVVAVVVAIKSVKKKLTSRVSSRYSPMLNAAGIFYFSSSSQILMQNTEE